jgi:hypothetical protein
MYTQELDYIERHFKGDAVTIHAKAEAAMKQHFEDWNTQVYVCPYCNSLNQELNALCCGEVHCVEMTKAQYNYMEDTGCSIEQALSYGEPNE